MRVRSSRREAGSRRLQCFPKPAAVLCALSLAVLPGCGAEQPAPRAPEVAPAVAPVDITTLPESTTFGDIPAAPPDPAPHERTSGVVLQVERDVPVHAAPDGPAFARLPATQLENPTWVPVVAEEGQWARVLLPSRPNGATGWVRTGSDQPIRKARSPYFVDIDIDEHRMVIYENDRVLGEWTVGVGRAETPTPRTRTFIMASIAETVTRFSPIILPLGVHSETFSTYGGGPGTVALHGWPESSVFGRDTSDGCVRVPDEALRALTSLPLGTVVRLR